jgi:hypothetical protein
MLTHTAIGQAGERAVALELMAMGYITNVDTRSPGSTDIEAIGLTANLLVQVKSAVAPNFPADLSNEEQGKIRLRAALLGWEPWSAKVQLDPWLNKVGNIIWRKLS